jgi:hypothetical protein
LLLVILAVCGKATRMQHSAIAGLLSIHIVVTRFTHLPDHDER